LKLLKKQSYNECDRAMPGLLMADATSLGILPASAGLKVPQSSLVTLQQVLYMLLLQIIYKVTSTYAL
jgi:hypothetical protein